MRNDVFFISALFLLLSGCLNQYMPPSAPRMPETQFINLSNRDSVNLTEGSGFVFGDGRYLLQVQNINFTSDLGCADIAIEYPYNHSEIKKLMLCQGFSQTWLSPDNRNFWISYISTNQNSIEIEITG